MESESIDNLPLCADIILLDDDDIDVDPRIGRYRVLERRANGRTTELFVALESIGEGSQRLVAIKRLAARYAADAAYVDCFVGGAYWLSRVQHPNVVRVYDLGEHDGAPFLALEYVAGASLRHLLLASLRDKVRMPIDACIAAIAQACAAVHAMHEAGVVHGELAPHDLLVTRDGDVKLVDIGLRGCTRPDDLRAARARYLAPEQIRGDGIDRRTDVFALGVIAWELLGERRVKARGTIVDVFEATLRGDRPPLRALRPEVPERIAAVIARATALDPAARPQTVAQLARELFAAADLDVSRAALERAMTARMSDFLRTRADDLDAQVHRSTPPPFDGVHGCLADLSLAEILQSLDLNARSGEVQVTLNGSVVGLLAVHERNVVCAAFGALRGADAFVALMALREGHFLLRHQTPRDEVRHMSARADLMLIEAMRAIDEGRVPLVVPIALPPALQLGSEDPTSLVARLQDAAREAQLEAELVAETAREEIARARALSARRGPVAAALVGVRLTGT